MNMRCNVGIATALALVTFARAEDCAPPGAASGLAAVLETSSNSQGEFQTVHLTWTNPPIDFDHMRIAYRHERRVKGATAWTTFARNLPTPFSDGNCSPFCGTFNAVRGPALSCTNGCVDPGNTYEYRVVLEYAYKDVCTQFDGGTFKHETAASNVAEITIPGPPASPPTNVRAVSDPKKPRVTVTWKNPSASYDRLEILRREIPGGPAAKADAEFNVIATLEGAQRLRETFTDKTPGADKYYEYAVALQAAEASAQSASDGSWTPGICPASNFLVWELGKYSLVEQKADFYVVPIDASHSAIRILQPCNSGICDPGEAPFVSGDGSFKPGVRSFRFPVKLDQPGGEYAALKMDFRGTLSASFADDDPFDPLAWTRGELTLKFAGKKAERRFVSKPDAFFDTTICGTISAPTQFKTKPARPGQKVAFAFQCAVLGPQPLLAKRMHVRATLEGGTFDHVAADFAQPLSAGSGGTEVEFEIAALGPESRTRSERATIALVAVAGAPTADGQLRCRVRFVEVPDTETTIFRQRIEVPIRERFAEVRVDAQVPGKAETPGTD